MDKIDKINVWNRLWLSAAATEAQILSVVLLDNHLHISALFQDDMQRTRFKRHFRMSITQYHNRRYNVSGTLGMRSFKHAELHDIEDLKDCICYHIRNVLHHNVVQDFWNYPYSTAKFVFHLAGGIQTGIYNDRTAPEKLLNDYLPQRESLPLGWLMTIEGMIVPPPEAFRADMVEFLFGNDRELYIETLSHKTIRESDDRDELRTFTVQLRKDEQVVEFVKSNFQEPIPSMTTERKMEAIRLINRDLTDVGLKSLSRIFCIPYTTLKYRLRNS